MPSIESLPDHIKDLIIRYLHSKNLINLDIASGNVVSDYFVNQVKRLTKLKDIELIKEAIKFPYPGIPQNLIKERI